MGSRSLRGLRRFPQIALRRTAEKRREELPAATHYGQPLDLALRSRHDVLFYVQDDAHYWLSIMERPPVIRETKAISRRNRKLFLLIVAVCVLGFLVLHALFDRTREFRAQAQAGQPIVRAIEDYHKQTGTYPPSLADLAPKYLAIAPDIPDQSQHKFIGWDYHIVTNGTAVSYSLMYYMGRGGVEYKPPNWIGNDEGHQTVVLSNQ